MGQRLGITVRGMGWNGLEWVTTGHWPIYGHHQGGLLDNPLWPFRVHSDTHLDIIRGFTQRLLGQEVRFYSLLDQNHRPRFSRAEASLASDRPGCNRDSTCSPM